MDTSFLDEIKLREDYTSVLERFTEDVLLHNNLKSVQIIAEGTMTPSITITHNDDTVQMIPNMEDMITILGTYIDKYDNFIKRGDKVDKITQKIINKNGSK